MKKITDLIEKYLRGEMSLIEIARELGLSRVQLNQKCKEIYGAENWRRTKIEQAYAKAKRKYWAAKERP